MKKNFVKALCMMGVMVCAISVFGETVSSPAEVTKQEIVITDPQQMYELGYAYLIGVEEGTPQDIELARYWFEQASAKGYGEASFKIGIMYYEGMYTKRNMTEAFKWYKKAAMQGNIKGMIHVGMMYLQGLDVPKDFKNGMKWINLAEKSATGEAYFWIGRVYETAEFGCQDINKTIEYYNKAIKKEFTLAYCGLANLYFNGDLVKEDTKKAIQYYIKGAELGDVVCIQQLDDIYSNGYNGAVNKKEALKWREKGVTLNSPSSLLAYGDMYAKGDGVPVNQELAREYYKKAAQAMDYCAMERYVIPAFVGSAKTYGNLRTDKDSALAALEFYKKAAHLGDGLSSACVGVFYENGYGVDVDLDEAHRWFQKAFETGDRLAVQYLMERGFVIKQ